MTLSKSSLSELQEYFNVELENNVFTIFLMILANDLNEEMLESIDRAIVERYNEIKSSLSFDYDIDENFNPFGLFIRNFVEATTWNT